MQVCISFPCLPSFACCFAFSLSCNDDHPHTATRRAPTGLTHRVRKITGFTAAFLFNGRTTRVGGTYDRQEQRSELPLSQHRVFLTFFCAAAMTDTPHQHDAVIYDPRMILFL